MSRFLRQQWVGPGCVGGVISLLQGGCQQRHQPGRRWRLRLAQTRAAVERLLGWPATRCVHHRPRLPARQRPARAAARQPACAPSEAESTAAVALWHHQVRHEQGAQHVADHGRHHETDVEGHHDEHVQVVQERGQACGAARARETRRGTIMFKLAGAQAAPQLLAPPAASCRRPAADARARSQGWSTPCTGIRVDQRPGAQRSCAGLTRQHGPNAVLGGRVGEQALPAAGRQGGVLAAAGGPQVAGHAGALGAEGVVDPGGVKARARHLEGRGGDAEHEDGDDGAHVGGCGGGDRVRVLVRVGWQSWCPRRRLRAASVGVQGWDVGGVAWQWRLHAGWQQLPTPRPHATMMHQLQVQGKPPCPPPKHTHTTPRPPPGVRVIQPSASTTSSSRWWNHMVMGGMSPEA